MIIPQGPSCAGDCAVQKGGKSLLPINLLVESVSRGVCVCVCVCVCVRACALCRCPCALVCESEGHGWD